MNLKKTYLFTFYLLLFTGLVSGGLLFNGCGSGDTSYKLTGDTITDGKNLTQLYCTKCHAEVPVNALNKNVWIHHTLPSMSHYLGVTPYLGGYYKSDTDTSGLSLQVWQVLVGYYQKMAPDTILTAKKPTPLTNDWAGFSLKTPVVDKSNISFTSMAAIDPDNHKIYTSDATMPKLTEWNADLSKGKVTELPSPGINAIFNKDGGMNSAILSCVGQYQPVDFEDGKVLKINLDEADTKNNQTLVESELNRPVQTIAGDFNKDGLTDYIVLAQGKNKGAVYMLKQNADHSFSQSTVSDQTGAVQGAVGDFDNDGWQDVMVLFGSGDEGLWLFTNDHKGGFTPKRLLRFPPVYGSTSFQLADLDHDGKLDVIYTCGYNYHDSRILKPYHGLYIFKNMGDWNLKQQWFFPINGCTKAIAADFKGNGTLEIVTSAFFADLKNEPEESVIYFENTGPFAYKPHAIPVSKYGRWMTMDVGDYNGDGKPDIVLGNYSQGMEFQLGMKPFWRKDLPFIVLQNDIKK